MTTSHALRSNLASFLSAIIAILAPPPPPRRLSEVARSLRITEGPLGPRPESPQGDMMDPNRHPPQRAVLRLFGMGTHGIIVVLGPPQTGKDTAIGAPIFIWTIAELRRPIVYATTDHRLMGALFRAKLLPPIETSDYARIIPQDGLGSGGGTPPEILWNTGVRSYLLGGGAQNGAGQAGVTAWAVIVTEADKLRGPQRQKLLDRNKAYGEEGRALLISTLERDDGKGLMGLYLQSTAGRMWHPCRHCGAWQPLDPDQVQYDPADADTARATARIKCRAQSCLWTEDDRQWSIKYSTEVFNGQTVEGRGVDGPDAGRVIGKPIAAEHAGFRWWAMDDPLRSLPLHAARKRQCKDVLARTGDATDLREFTRTEEVACYVNKDEVLELRENDLALRSADAIHLRGQAPADADICAIGVDQQKRRLLFNVIAYRIRDRCWWTIDYGFKGIATEGEEPTDAQAHAAFDAIHARVMAGYPRPNGTLLKPMIGLIDTADGNTRDRALAWLSGRIGWFALRGERGEHHASDAAGEAIFRLPSVLTIYKQTKTIPHWHQFAPDVDALKGEIFRALSRKPDSPGAGHLPKGEGGQDDLIMQLCAERQEMTPEGPRWIQIRRHNHQLDNTVYALAGCKYLAHLHSVNDSTDTNSAADYAAAIAKG